MGFKIWPVFLGFRFFSLLEIKEAIEFYDVVDISCLFLQCTEVRFTSFPSGGFTAECCYSESTGMKTCTSHF